jgi:hypothetical protein
VWNFRGSERTRAQPALSSEDGHLELRRGTRKAEILLPFGGRIERRARLKLSSRAVNGLALDGLTDCGKTHFV